MLFFSLKMDKIKWDDVKEHPKKHGSHFLDKEINIDVKINPKKAFKGVAVVVIFLVVFGLGRWSAGSEGCPTCVQEDILEESSSSGFFSMLTGLFHSEEPEELLSEEELAEEPTDEVEEEEEAAEEVEEEIVEEEEVVEVDEPIITTYNKVSFAIQSVSVEWHDTWGKITTLQFTIKNNEEGTILPDHFSMVVEGYPDESSKKKVPLPDGSKEIRSKTTASSTAIIPSGFNYNEKTTGALDDVEIRFILFDENSKPMASYRQTFNLDRS